MINLHMPTNIWIRAIAKNEAVDNFIVCSNKIQNCVTLSDEGNEKTTIGLISKKATLHVLHTFFVHFFAVVLHDYNGKLPETS